MAQLNFSLGTEVLYKNQPAIIIKIVDIDLISVQLLESNIVYTVKVNEVSPLKKSTNIELRPYDSLTDREWETAKFRFEVIKPILNIKLSSEEIKEISKKHNLHYTTVYRWIKTYLETKQITSLAGQKRTGGKNKNRLNQEQDTVINDAIKNIYLY